MPFRDYAEDPAPAEASPDDPRLDESDYGNVVSMEHLNLEVPDLEVARLFYSEVLGLTLDPSMVGAQRGGPQVVWYNIGRQQLHICKGAKAQLLPPGGSIGLVLPHVDNIVAQANALRPLLGEIPVTLITPGVIQITDPHGVVFMIHKQYKGFCAAQGIVYLNLPCFVGTSAAIGRFYSHMLGAPVKLHGAQLDDDAPRTPRCVIRQDSTTGDGPEPLDRTSAPGAPIVPKAPTPLSPSVRFVSNTGGGVREGARAHVQLGVPGTHLVFFEEPDLGPWSTQGALSLFQGWHICFYISQFSHCYSRLRNLLFNAHPYRDKVHTFHDALAHHQFRFQDVVLLPDEFVHLAQLENKVDHSLVPAVPAGAVAPVAGRSSVAVEEAADGSTADGVTDEQKALVPRGAMELLPVQSLVAHDEGTVQGVPRVPGQLLYRLSHEVRSLSHPLFLRPLYNRAVGHI